MILEVNVIFLLLLGFCVLVFWLLGEIIDCFLEWDLLWLDWLYLNVVKVKRDINKKFFIVSKIEVLKIINLSLGKLFLV